jgi:mannose-6-phosphate isomerase-like protein (cupin superfamily)
VHSVIRSDELRATGSGSKKFEGEPYRSEVSFFVIGYDEPGRGPGLHRHPYSETWVIHAGTARFTAGTEEVDAGPGDVLVVEAGVPHKFVSTGTDRLDMVCIHAAPRMVQEELER